MSQPDPPLDAPSWPQLQALRRGALPVQPWIEGLASGVVAPDPLLLAALWGRLDRPAVERLLGSSLGLDPTTLLAAGRSELPLLAGEPAVQDAWLEALLAHQQSRPAAEAPAWLELLGQFRHPLVAARLRAALRDPNAAWPAQSELEPLLPLLGRQREPVDAPLLQRLVTEPGPSRWRRAALEGLALGLSAWPVDPLIAALATLARDLDADLAAAAVDLLARLPQAAARTRLRGQLAESLDPAVRTRLLRRLRLSPLVLLVHGRQGGVIPPELLALAADLERRRGAPVLLQALTAEPPEPSAAFLQAAGRAGALTLVPLLLLPGGHVRCDLPAIAAVWRRRAEAMQLQLRRRPFLGAWPAWQQALVQLRLGAEPAAFCWLHHPLEDPLGQRYLAHLAALLGGPGLATPYTASTADLHLQPGGSVVLLPLTLAANRLSESLASAFRSADHPPVAASSEVLTLLPPLLDNPALRQFLLSALEVLP
jgi:hypothetical protein